MRVNVTTNDELAEALRLLLGMKTNGEVLDRLRADRRASVELMMLAGEETLEGASGAIRSVFAQIQEAERADTEGSDPPVFTEGSTAALIWNFRRDRAATAAHLRLWAEFKRTGLLWWVNRSLHLFGWSIVFLVESGSADVVPTAVYAARTAWRGFSRATEEVGFERLTGYLAATGPELHAEVREDGSPGPDRAVVAAEKERLAITTWLRSHAEWLNDEVRKGGDPRLRERADGAFAAADLIDNGRHLR